MAQAIAKVEMVKNGSFFAEDAGKNLRVLKNGETIYDGEKVVGALANTQDATITLVTLEENPNEIILTGSTAQLFDLSLMESAFDSEEATVSASAWQNTLASNFDNASTLDEVVDGEETAAGEEAATSSDSGVFVFDARDGVEVRAEASISESVLGYEDGALIGKESSGGRGSQGDEGDTAPELNIVIAAPTQVIIGNGDEFISANELDENGNVDVIVKLPEDGVKAGDIVVVNGTEQEITQEDIDSGEVVVLVPVDVEEGEEFTATATIKDKNGNESDETETTATLDTQAPEVDITEIKVIDTDSLANNEANEVEITFTSNEPNAPYEVIQDDKVIASGTTDENGNATVTIPAQEIELGQDVTVEVTDKAGNSGSDTDEVPGSVTDFTDTTAPEVDITEIKVIDTDSLANNEADEVEITFTSNEPNAPYEVIQDDKVIASGTTDENGNATVTIPAQEIELGQDVTVEVTDKAGNSGSDTDEVPGSVTDFTDTTAPEVDITEIKVIDTDSLANNEADEVEIIFTSNEPNAPYEVIQDDKVIASGTTDENGNATVTIPSQEIELGQDVTVEVTDKAGNSGSDTDEVPGSVTDFTDTTAPEVDITEIKVIDTDSLANNEADEVEIIFTSNEPNAPYEVIQDDKVIASGTTDENGNATVTIPAQEIELGQDVTVEVTDKAGNSGSDTDEVPGSVTEFTDTTAPEVDITEIKVIDTDSLANNEANEVEITFTSNEPNAPYEVIQDDKVIASGTTDENGNATVTIPAQEIELGQDVTVEVTDKAGNSGSDTDEVPGSVTDFTDTTAPEVDITEIKVIDTDSLANNEADEVEIIFTSNEPNAPYEVIQDDKVIASGTTDENGNATVTIPANEIELGQDVTVEVTDKAGNSGSDTDEVPGSVTEFTDTTAPEVDITEIKVIDTDSPANNEANEVEITFTSNEPNAPYEVIQDDKVIASGTTDENGNATVTIPAQEIELGQDVTVEVTDKAGNSGSDTDEVPGSVTDFTDTTAPEVDITEIKVIDTDSLANNEADEVEIIFTSNEPNAPYEVIQDDKVIASGTTDENGNATVTIPANEIELGQDVTVEVTDKAGNSGSDTDEVPGSVTEFTDTTAPEVDITEIKVIDTDSLANNEADEVEIIFTSNEPNAPYEVIQDDKVIASGTTDENGNATVTIPSQEIELGQDVTVEVTDKAGNSGSDTDEVPGSVTDFTDTTAPEVDITEIKVIDTDSLANNEADEVEIIFTSNEPNAPYEVIQDDKVIASGTTDENGNATVTIPSQEIELGQDVTVEVTDKAGNSGSDTDEVPGSVTDFTDTTAPEVDITEIKVIDTDSLANNEADEVEIIFTSNEPNAPYEVIQDDKVIASGTTDENGNATVTIPAQEIELGQDVTVEVTDKAGNSGSDTDEVPGSVTEFTDTTAPEVDITEIKVIDTDSLANNEANEVEITFTSNEPNAPYEVIQDDKVIASGTTDENGNATVTIPAQEIELGQDVTVEVTDKAGNSGSDTDEVPGSVTDFTDTTAPEVDITEIKVIDTDSLANNEANEVEITFTSNEPNAPYEVIQDDKVIASGTTDENGNATVTIPAQEIELGQDVTVEVTDKAGNSGSDTDEVPGSVTDFTDTTAPEVDITEIKVIDTDSLANNEADEVEIIFTSNEPNAPYEVIQDDKVIASGTTDENGNATVTIPANEIELGQDVTVEVTDKAGNSGSDTDEVPGSVTEFTDTTAPEVDITEIKVIDTDSLANNEADEVEITFTSNEPNAPYEVIQDDKVIASGTTDENGNATVTIPSQEIELGQDVTVEVTDKAGNTGSDTDEVPGSVTDFTDTTAPEIPLITDIVDETGDYSKVTMHGTGEVGATITLYAKEGSTTAGNATNESEYVVAATVIVGEDGKWSVDISNLDTTPVNDNEFFYVTATDKAGNVSEPSETVHYYHGDWTNITTEAEDDYVFLGEGDDKITINANDANDKLVIDGGDGQDRAIFTNNFADYEITNENGNIFVKDISGETNDLVELRNFEKIEFSDGVYDIENEDFDPSSASLIIEPVYKDGEGSFKEGESITLKATLSVAAKSDMTITLDNGEEIEIKKGDTEGFVTFENPNEEDVYIDAETLEYSLEVSGGFNENTNIEKPSSIKVEITDTVDTTKVTLTPTIHTAVEKDIVINVDSINQEGSGFKVTALDHEGNSAEVVVNGSPIGFGILSNNQKIGDKDNTGYSGAPVEIGVINTGTSLKPVYESEKLIIEFDNEISSLNIGLAWLNKSTSITEKAKIKFYGTSGEEYEVILDGATDANGFVEQSFKDLEFSVSKIEFTAVGKDSDFLVNKIEFTEIVSEEVNTLIPGQESTIVYEIKTEHKPDASKFTFEGNDFPTATVEVNGKEYTVNLNKEGVGKLEIEHDGQTELNAKVTAVNGNFEKVDLDEAVSSLEAVATQVHLTDMQVVSSMYYEDIENVVTEVWKDWKDAMFAVSNETTYTNNELTGNSEIAFKIGGNGTITKTSNLTIKPIDGSNIPTLFEVGDVYEVSWKESKTPYKVQMTVTRSDSKSVSGEPMDIVILTGVVNGKETAVIIDSTNIGTNTNYFKNDLWDSTVGDANDYVGYIDYTVSGTSYANAEISIKSIVDGDEKEIGNAIADVNGHWSADLKELTGKSGTLKIESTDEHGNTTEDVKSYLFGESGNDVLIGSDGDDFIYGGAGADELYGEDGDDTLVTDLNTDSTAPSGDTVLDGGSGFDTLVLEENNSIDFSKLGDYAEIKNIEVIDLTKGDHKLDNLSIKDVFDMTDDKNELIILGDEKDSISPLNGDIWANKGTVTQSVNGALHTLEVYEATFDNDKTVTVKIEEEIVIL